MLPRSVASRSRPPTRVLAAGSGAEQANPRRGACTAIAGSDNARAGISSEERFVIFASSSGTVFEWHDFYL